MADVGTMVVAGAARGASPEVGSPGDPFAGGAAWIAGLAIVCSTRSAKCEVRSRGGNPIIGPGDGGQPVIAIVLPDWA